MTFEAKPLRDRIMGHLLEVGADSISGVARAVSADRERPIHRLTVAGYLSCLTEAGLVREVDRPPSKQYQVTNPQAHKDLYRYVADAVRHVPMPQHERGPTAIAALVRLLARPVFRAELNHARIPVPDHLPRARVSDEERRTLRTLVPTRMPKIDVPRGDPLFEAPTTGGPVDEVLRRALLAATGAAPWAWDAAPRATQAALPLEER